MRAWGQPRTGHQAAWDRVRARSGGRARTQLVVERGHDLGVGGSAAWGSGRGASPDEARAASEAGCGATRVDLLRGVARGDRKRGWWWHMREQR